MAELSDDMGALLYTASLAQALLRASTPIQPIKNRWKNGRTAELSGAQKGACALERRIKRRTGRSLWRQVRGRRGGRRRSGRRRGGGHRGRRGGVRRGRRRGRRGLRRRDGGGVETMEGWCSQQQTRRAAGEFLPTRFLADTPTDGTRRSGGRRRVARAASALLTARPARCLSAADLPDPLLG